MMQSCKCYFRDFGCNTIACARNGTILVADKVCAQAFTDTGVFLFTVGSDVLVAPKGIACDDEKGEIFVGNNPKTNPHIVVCSLSDGKALRNVALQHCTSVEQIQYIPGYIFVLPRQSRSTSYPQLQVLNREGQLLRTIPAQGQPEFNKTLYLSCFASALSVSSCISVRSTSRPRTAN